MKIKEDLLHYLWRYQKFSHKKLKTIQGISLEILSPGFLNQGVGPDFSNAKIRMDKLLWTGPVELHVSASAWYQHNHHRDSNYDAVILHVVWEADVDVCLANGTPLPTLCLSHNIETQLLERHKALFLKKKKFISCEDELPNFDQKKWLFWKERLYVERLEEQTLRIQDLLVKTTSHWDAVLFHLLAKGFGLNKNSAAFLAMAQSIPFGVILKCQNRLFQLEALFFGQLGLLTEAKEGYALELKQEYTFLKSKFSLRKTVAQSLTFGRLRPANFPTLRLAQLAQLYHNQGGLFQKLMHAKNPQTAKKYLSCSPSDYWKTHYHFEIKSKMTPKASSNRFKDLLLINVVIPLRFSYFKQ